MDKPHTAPPLAEARVTEVPEERTSSNVLNLAIAVLSILSIAAHLVLRFGFHSGILAQEIPLWIALGLGGSYLVFGLARKALAREFGSDLLAGFSIITAVILHEYLAGTIVVLMLSGGEALEAYAVRSASSVLRALAKRMPSIAHRLQGADLKDVPLEDVAVGDHLVVLPHDICPVDGVVTEGHGVMDESYLTGEPFQIPKTPGSEVISGAINGEVALTIQATRRAVDSRYAKIAQVMHASQQQRPHIRRLGDQLGAYYTPVAVAIAVIAWIASGSATRFLAVLVVATPCPLLIGIPVAIIGSISLCAKRSLIIRDPTALEQSRTCSTMIFDKTGTLTYGKPKLTEQTCVTGVEPRNTLSLVASLEQYSRHPLAEAVMQAAHSERIALHEASEISERPGQGLRGTVEGYQVTVTSRRKLLEDPATRHADLPKTSAGLECVILIDGRYAATYGFRDEPRIEGVSFIRHLKPKHGIRRLMIVSGDREQEVRYLADKVGITEVFAGQTPEQKLVIVREETARGKTIYVGDGINDAPALMAATVGVAIGKNSDVTSEAAGVVVLDSSLARVDEFLHISQRMRSIALQSAVGGMLLSIGGMILASVGLLPPVAGAVFQEVIDVFAVLNALRAALPPPELTDFQAYG